MSVQDEALRLRGCGFNCSQSVLAALGSYTGLEKNTALAITGGFGGGVRSGEICGAVCGAVMAMGLAFPYTDGADAQQRAKISRLTLSVTKEFSEHFGCIRCFDLKQKGVPCPELIAYAAQLAEQKIQENK